MKKIALAQMNSSDQLSENLETSLKLIDEASAAGASLIAFPETFLFMGKHSDSRAPADEIPGKLTAYFQEAAKSHRISVLLGSMLEEVGDSGQKYYNTSVLIGDNGEIAACYRKIHLFDVDLPSNRILESDRYMPGKEVVTYNHEITKLGFSICYDIRFPGLYSKLAAQGANLIFVPAAFTLETGKDHWIPLLRARAIENQVYIAAPAQYGKHQGNRMTYGNTVIIDPWGTILSRAAYKTGLIYADIDLDFLEQTRSRMPVHQHKVSKIDL